MNGYLDIAFVNDGRKQLEKDTASSQDVEHAHRVIFKIIVSNPLS